MAARLGAYLYFFNIEISPKKLGQTYLVQNIIAALKFYRQHLRF